MKRIRKCISVLLVLCLTVTAFGSLSAFAAEKPLAETQVTQVARPSDRVMSPAFAPLSIGDITGFDVYSVGGINAYMFWDEYVGASHYVVNRLALGAYETYEVTDTTFNQALLPQNTRVRYWIEAYDSTGAMIAESAVINVNTTYNLNGVVVSADATGPYTQTVTWESRYADYYAVYQAPSLNGPYTFLANVDGLEYAVGGLTPNTEYYYFVLAYDVNTAYAVGYASAMTELPIDVPSNLTAQAKGTGQIDLTWSPVSNVDGYVVYYAVGPNPSAADFQPISTLYGQNVASFTHSGLQADTTYHYYLKAFRGNNTSDATATVSATTYPLVPVAPLNVTATGLDNSRIQVTWSPVYSADGYYIYRSATQNGTYTRIGTTTGNAATSYINTGLAANTGYYYKVSAYNITAEGNQSAPAYGATLAPRPTKAPVCVCAKTLSLGSIQISWKALDKTQIVTGYHVYRSTSLYGSYVYAGSTPTTVFVDTGLNPSTKYYYKVAAYNNGGVGPLSCTVCACTKALCAPACPYGKAMSSSSVYFSWSAVPGSFDYQVWRATSRNGNYELVQFTTTTNFLDTGLNANTTYYYKVHATYNGVLSPQSAIIAVKTAKY